MEGWTFYMEKLPRKKLSKFCFGLDAHLETLILNGLYWTGLDMSSMALLTFELHIPPNFIRHIEYTKLFFVRE